MITFSQLGRYGRFANQLFQIAGTIGLATKHGYSYAFPKWINYDHKDRFGSTEDVDLQKYFVNPLPASDINLPDFPISWGYHPDMRIPDGVSLSGHMQSEKYFKHCKDVIQHYFAMKEEDSFEDFVAIHVRLGDYDNQYHTRLDQSYYARAIEQFPPATKFVVFSDDPLAAAMIIATSTYASHSGGLHAAPKQSYFEDFRMMKRCGGFICGNSSFSLMAAILSPAKKKKIVCPSQWFGPAWTPETKDLYPENAIII